MELVDCGDESLAFLDFELTVEEVGQDDSVGFGFLGGVGLVEHF